MYDDDGNITGLARKPTRFRMTSEWLAQKLTLNCICQLPHVPLHGSQLRDAQNYEDELANLMAQSILDLIIRERENFYAADEEKDPKDIKQKEILNELKANFCAEVIQEGAKMHQLLGHPSRRL